MPPTTVPGPADRFALDRRTLVRTAAWGVPAIVVTAQAPAHASSAGAALALNGERYAAVLEDPATAPDGWSLYNHLPPLSWEVAALESDTSGLHVGHPFGYDLVVTNPGQVPLADVTVSVFHLERARTTSSALDALDVVLRPSSTLWTHSRTREGLAAGDTSTTPTTIGWRHDFVRPGELPAGEAWDLEFVLRSTGPTSLYAEPPLTDTLHAVTARAGNASLTDHLALGVRYSD